ncbi:hypothetical protein AUR64_15025 [Haloprofundus marisrubri]|uniref:Uncharacterized protein n=1 Tax=Haloprofundus marisrubri TaxID=1514971 RepID=A0A0W1R7W7_9EURY|nr:hypothetical protein [Haloprofundus marisrubri]KTG09108.1 hypothetical protein AUR64_15025 [Haloprofundus marisrubri]
MDFGIVLIGVVVLSFGAVAHIFPHRIRSFQSPRQWQKNPEKAKQRQETYGRILGSVLVTVGALLVFGGLVV